MLVALAVLAFAFGTSGYMIKVPVAPISQPIFAPSGWIHIQKLVLPLFENVCEDSTDPTIIRLSQEFASNVSPGEFWDPDVLTQFQVLKSGKGFLRKGEIFSDYNDVHVDELKIMFNVMRSAKNFDSFYKVAAWARQNLNCGLYVNLIYMAMENRKDTEKLTLPPPYELLPNYFIRKDIIIQGSSLLAGEEFTPSEGARDEGNAYTLDANYTANFYDNDDESKLAYFREDIGLNSYYFLNMLKRAPRLNENVDINSRYGEDMYHMMKQLVARYNLERYSNGMAELDNMSWDSLSDVPYDPMLVYSNGNEFIHRTSPVQLPENEDKALLHTIENNIATVVSHMRETGYNKTQILNHLMEILVTGERSYDTLARHLLGKALSNNGQPTVFEHYMTSLRDPMIWKLYKKMVDLIDESINILPSYSKSELYFPGVEVVNVDVKKVMTNFDYFEFDISEALKIGNDDTSFQVKIGQPRLNHKPFMMKVNISSLVTQRGIVKVYVGPKMMPGEFAKKKNMFFQLDCFEINLKRGTNIVTRTSSDIKQLSPDFMSFKTLRKKVEDAQFGLNSMAFNSIDSQINFPERLSIPRGTLEGLPLQLFVFVAPYTKTSTSGAYQVSNTEFNSAVLSPLYPLDLPMVDRILLDLPNAFVKDIFVTHKSASKVSNYGESGATKSWYDSSDSGPPPRSNTYSGQKEPFDYKSKKGQYEQNDNTYNTPDQYDGNQDDNYFNDVQNDGVYQGVKPNRPASNYDYSSKRKEPFDYKSKRVDYKALYQNKVDKKPEIENMQEKLLTKEDQMTSKFEDLNAPQVPNEGVYNAMDFVNMEQNDDSAVKVKYSPIKSSEKVYKTKPKSKFDYKSMRPKYEKVDYKALYKNAWKTTEAPVDIENMKQIKQDLMLNENKMTKKIDKSVVKEMSGLGNVDIYKTVKNTDGVDSTESMPNKQDKLIIKDDGKYMTIYEDSNNEEFLKVVPVPEKDKENTIFKYIMGFVDHITDDDALISDLDNYYY